MVDLQETWVDLCFFAQEWLIYRKHGLIYVFVCPRMVDLQETWVDLCFLLPKNG